MTFITACLRRAAFTSLTLMALVQGAQAQHAGLRTLTVPGEVPATVALFYPTETVARPMALGPWTPVVAPGASPRAGQFRGLVLISHGTGGTEMNHHPLATRLAREGYMVAAIRHPGDNWQDRSMFASRRYLSERPRQLSRVLDALLADPEWGPRIPSGRIAAVGHSAGGFSALALAGGQADASRLASHCQAVQDDPVFCSLAQGPAMAMVSGLQPAYAAAPTAASGPVSAPPPEAAGPVNSADPRVKAVVALAPMAVVFTPDSLAQVSVPVRLIAAGRDTVLNGRHHAHHLARHLPNVTTSVEEAAGHFAFMAPSRIPLPSDAGDAASDAAGFDRAAYLPRLEDDILQFLSSIWPCAQGCR